MQKIETAIALLSLPNKAAITPIKAMANTTIKSERTIIPRRSRLISCGSSLDRIIRFSTSGLHCRIS